MVKLGNGSTAYSANIRFEEGEVSDLSVLHKVADDVTDQRRPDCALGDMCHLANSEPFERKTGQFAVSVFCDAERRCPNPDLKVSAAQAIIDQTNQAQTATT
ncbi:MAG TPA: hypothetical protein VJJ78_01075 [Candidatus Saccharimonadales bacterium]|nr:hypothetical protein [Candidatus Saccharimonadales bacterium]